MYSCTCFCSTLCALPSADTGSVYISEAKRFFCSTPGVAFWCAVSVRQAQAINTGLTGGSGVRFIASGPGSPSCTLRSFISLCLPTLKRICEGWGDVGDVGVGVGGCSAARTKRASLRSECISGLSRLVND